MEEEPTEINICPAFLPESFSFLFMKLYWNVYQIKTVSHSIMVSFPLFVQSYDCLFSYFSETVLLSTHK